MADLNNYKIRWRWLKFMYIYTAIIAGGIGLAQLIAHFQMQSTLGMAQQDPLVFGLGASVFLALGLVAILGIRAPLKYSPILLVELVYKLLWLCGVVAPLALRGEFPKSSMVQVAIFCTFVVGNLIAIPFRYIFGRDTGIV